MIRTENVSLNKVVHTAYAEIVTTKSGMELFTQSIDGETYAYFFKEENTKHFSRVNNELTVEAEYVRSSWSGLDFTQFRIVLTRKGYDIYKRLVNELIAGGSETQESIDQLIVKQTILQDSLYDSYLEICKNLEDSFINRNTLFESAIEIYCANKTDVQHEQIVLMNNIIKVIVFNKLEKKLDQIGELDNSEEFIAHLKRYTRKFELRKKSFKYATIFENLNIDIIEEYFNLFVILSNAEPFRKLFPII